jgi:ribosomal protein S18 acetylase RimI-like enzyme
MRDFDDCAKVLWFADARGSGLSCGPPYILSFMPHTVREAASADAPVIAEFNIALAWETEHKRLDPSIVGQGVRAGIADPAKAKYFVAESDGRAIACCMVTHEWSDWRNGDIWWFQSVYVDPNCRRQGVFASMYRHVAAAARKNGAVGLRLYVESENARAQATYLSLGMSRTSYNVMEQMF